MKELIQNLPFKLRILFGCLIVALIPLLFAGVFMVHIFDTSLRRQAVAEIKKQSDEAQQRLDHLFLSCEMVCRRLNKDDSAYRVLIDNTSIEVQKDFYLALYQAVQETYSYASISIYDAGGMLRFTTDNNHAIAPVLPIHWGLLRKASMNTGLIYYGTDPYITKDPNIILQAACSLENRHGARAGYIVLDFTKDSFNRLFSSNYTDKDVLLLLDSLQEPVYCSRPSYGEAEITPILNQARSDLPANRFLYHSVESADYHYTVLFQKSAPISSPAIRTMKRLSIIITFFCLGLCFIVSLVLSRGISQPISQLDYAMKKVRDGDLTIQIHTNRNDELGRLSNSFNRMTCEIRDHLETAVQKQKDLNETTLQLYQTQLNPHFLYNTLDTIKWSAKINQDRDIPVLAENLAHILRRSISSAPFITLYDELETIGYYIEIQKIRFSGRFLYEKEIPCQLEECLVPKMLLQPLVENAILHGLDGCEHGYICIYAKICEDELQKETLQVAVTDDGCGMDANMIAWVNSPNPQKHIGHLGLYNIIRILKLYYGEEYGLHAALNPEGGTTITISLPHQRR